MAQEHQRGSCDFFGIAKDDVELNTVEQDIDRKDTKGKAEVTDTVDDEGFHRSSRCRRLGIPETDQKIRCQTNALPAEEQLDQVVGGNQHQHRKGEQAQIRHEARLVRIMRHIADGIDVNHRGHAGHNDQHHTGQRINTQRPGRIKAARGNPGKQFDHNRVATQGNIDKGKDRNHKGNHDTGNGDQLSHAISRGRTMMVMTMAIMRGLLRGRHGADQRDGPGKDCRDQGQEYNQRIHICLTPSSC